MKTDTVYLLCFAPGIPRGPRAGNARHYLGSCVGDPQRRLAEHVSGKGSPLVKAAAARGLEVRLALTIPGDRQLERRLKQARNTASRLCPICRGVSA